MFILGNILIGLGQVLYGFLWIYKFILLGRAIVSWVNADRSNAIVRFLILSTEPPLRVVRSWLPMKLRSFPLDIAFLVLFALVIFAEYAVVASLITLGQSLGGRLRIFM
jgi:YggT family protein